MQTRERLVPDPANGTVKTIRFAISGFGKSGFGKLALHVLNRAWLNHASCKLLLGAKVIAKSMQKKKY